MTFLLLATWLWLHGRWRRAASYPVSLLSLLSFEPCFLPFLAVPLLEISDKQQTIRRWTSHAAGCGSILGALLWVRVATADSRVAEAAANPGVMLYRAATSLVMGPATSAGLFVTGTLSGLAHLDLVAMAIAGIMLLSFMAAWRISPSEGSTPQAPAALPWWWVGGAALVMWSVSYALSLADHYPPTQTLERTSATHTPAAWPACLAVAALVHGACSSRKIPPRLSKPRLGSGSSRLSVIPNISSADISTLGTSNRTSGIRS